MAAQCGLHGLSDTYDIVIREVRMRDTLVFMILVLSDFVWT